MFLHTLTKRRCALSGEVFAAAPHVVRIGLVDAPLDGEVGGELRLGEPLQAPEGQRLALLVEGGVVPVYMSRSLRTSWEQALGVLRTIFARSVTVTPG